MTAAPVNALRAALSAQYLAPSGPILDDLRARWEPAPTQKASAVARAQNLVRAIREDKRPGLMETFLAEYGLSSREGVALMCLAEALLRVPDAETMDALIEDKIAPSSWSAHLGQSSSPLVNASTWALMLTGKVLQDGQEGVAQVLRSAVKRVGEPVIRAAVARAMKEMGRQFVLGQTIDEALQRARTQEARGFTYSYDMLGEAAMTAPDAAGYFRAYDAAIARIATAARGNDVETNPGISVKLSALFPRYEATQRARVMEELVPRLVLLAERAAAAGIGLNVDAEEADRLELSLDVINAALTKADLGDWGGFGVVVQAYGKRAPLVIDWLDEAATAHDRRLMVRLVKGAYWDTEIKRAQVEGLVGFPVWLRKEETDVAYICAARKLLSLSSRLYPQFATHNAHTVASILAEGADPAAYEFQRLHGMGEALHDLTLEDEATRCRIYAPVGAHRDLLAYLVRRLLENGANSSFVNQIVDVDVPAEVVAADPFDALDQSETPAVVRCPADLFQPERVNSLGWDLRTEQGLAAYDTARAPFAQAVWEAGPLIAGDGAGVTTPREVTNPARPADQVGVVHEAGAGAVDAAFAATGRWQATAERRAATLNATADLFEARSGEFFALLAREAGKTPLDAVAELREAVDFLRYYAARAGELAEGSRGVIGCISPWNFPLAIFTGQIAAALAAGNGVIAKPAETTALTAHLATRLLHEAGVPRASLALLPGAGAEVGRALSAHGALGGLAFTGSTATAQAINRAMASAAHPAAPLIAETGGLNAMIVDSTALPEQSIRDIVASAFQSAGQRCSALRVLYLQSDVEETFLKMLFGAMDELAVGDPWALATDTGPVIDDAAQTRIEAHVARARAEGRLLKSLSAPSAGTFVGPAVVRIDTIGDLKEEIFGPVLHVARFEAEDIDAVVDDINATGFGLTFGLHSRIDDRIEALSSSIRAGNIYVNRNQIGAIVGSQPFGGEGLSGTGPKAGGPDYVARFAAAKRGQASPADKGRVADIAEVQVLVDHAAAGFRARPVETLSLPGPTGEENRLSRLGRGVILCLGPGPEASARQAAQVETAGALAVQVTPGASGPRTLDANLAAGDLTQLTGIAGVVLWGDEADLRAARIALADRAGPILPLIADADLAGRVQIERHLCVDTTAAGGNAQLLAEAS